MPPAAGFSLHACPIMQVLEASAGGSDQHLLPGLVLGASMLQVLESILDDDKDMQDCYLGRRAALAAATEAAGKDAEPSEGTAGGLTSARPTVDLPEGQPAAAGEASWATEPV